jgi:thiamine-phosphate pyrophosphorylase
LICYVTDRRQLGAVTDSAQIKTLLEKISSAAAAGVDWVQIREKDLDAAALSELVREAIRCVPSTCRILVNDRLDVACALGAAGVHLGERSIPVGEARRFALKRGTAKEFLIGASVHSLEAALAAQKDGAD